MSLDAGERRYLGAVRFVDRATGGTIQAPLALSAEGCRWHQNRSGLWVIGWAPGLAEHTRSFERAPGAPAAGTVPVTVDVADRSGDWLPRRFTLTLPRAGADSGPAPAVDVALSPSPAAPARRNWGQIRVAVRLNSAEHPGGLPAEGALLRVSGGGREATGLTDARGEGLVLLPGVPLFSSSDSSTAVIERRASLRLWVVVEKAGTDPKTGARRHPPDPDALWTARSTAGCVQHSRSFTLAAGESRSFSVQLDLG